MSLPFPTICGTTPCRGGMGYLGVGTQRSGCHFKEGYLAVKQPFVGWRVVEMALRQPASRLYSSGDRRGTTFACRCLTWSGARAEVASGMSTAHNATNMAATRNLMRKVGFMRFLQRT